MTEFLDEVAEAFTSAYENAYGTPLSEEEELWAETLAEVAITAWLKAAEAAGWVPPWHECEVPDFDVPYVPIPPYKREAVPAGSHRRGGAPMIHFTVEGEAVPQGSMVAMQAKNQKRPFVVPANKTALGKWRTKVKKAAEAVADEWGIKPPGLNEPVLVHIEFHRTRPKSSHDDEDSTGPDGDKLTRAIFDGITNVLVCNDARIVEGLFRKRLVDGPSFTRVHFMPINRRLRKP